MRKDFEKNNLKVFYNYQRTFYMEIWSSSLKRKNRKR